MRTDLKALLILAVTTVLLAYILIGNTAPVIAMAVMIVLVVLIVGILAPKQLTEVIQNIMRTVQEMFRHRAS